MDHPASKNREDPAAAAPPPRPPPAKKKPTSTLLDAYEVECIRRELERRLVIQRNQKGSAAGRGDGFHGASGGNKTTTTTRSARNVKVVGPSSATRTAPEAAAKTTKQGSRGRGGMRLLGRHAVAFCSGNAPVSVTEDSCVLSAFAIARPGRSNSGGAGRDGGAREA